MCLSAIYPEHEVGIMMTNFGQSVLMYVTHVSYEDPVLMVFKGFVNGREALYATHPHSDDRIARLQEIGAEYSRY